MTSHVSSAPSQSSGIKNVLSLIVSAYREANELHKISRKNGLTPSARDAALRNRLGIAHAA